MRKVLFGWMLAAIAWLAAPALAQTSSLPPVHEADFTLWNFHFRSGEALPVLKLHYRTLGAPRRDATGRIVNMVMILHGTGGDGTTFLRPIFASELFGPGQPLDASRYFIVLPDAIGHGGSSKPSDGLRMKFPRYDYADMVEADHRLATDGLGAGRVRLVLGTSMGCMTAFAWGEAYPDDMAALAPFACLPTAIVGRNRLWRRMLIEAIKSDPAWQGGDYASEPQAGLRAASDLLTIAGSAPQQMQKTLATREAVDQSLAERTAQDLAHLDADNLIYQIDASRDYDPSKGLETITAPVLWINSADDFINPPELGIAEREAPRLKRGRFILLPIGENTHGHGTHTWAVAWKAYLAEFLRETESK